MFAFTLISIFLFLWTKMFYVTIYIQQEIKMFNQLLKPFNKLLPYAVGILCSCIAIIFIAGCITVVDTSVVKFWSYRETVRTASVRYNTYLQRPDCILVDRTSSLNDAKFECGNETIHLWIP